MWRDMAPANQRLWWIPGREMTDGWGTEAQQRSEVWELLLTTKPIGTQAEDEKQPLRKCQWSAWKRPRIPGCESFPAGEMGQAAALPYPLPELKPAPQRGPKSEHRHTHLCTKQEMNDGEREGKRNRACDLYSLSFTARNRDILPDVDKPRTRDMGKSMKIGPQAKWVKCGFH